MLHSTLAIAVNWYGPFPSIMEAGAEAKRAEVGEGLYLAIRRTDDSAYVGMSINVPNRLTRFHHMLSEIQYGEAEIWVGAVVSPHPVRRKEVDCSSVQTGPVRISEWMIAYFLELSHNGHLRRNPPSKSAVVVNRWFNSRPPYARKATRGHKHWPDVIEYDRENATAKLAWLGGGLTVLNAEGIDGLKRNSN